MPHAFEEVDEERTETAVVTHARFGDKGAIPNPVMTFPRQSSFSLLDCREKCRCHYSCIKKTGNRKPERVLFNAVGEWGSFDGLFCLWW